jgi:hypothetical protein
MTKEYFCKNTTNGIECGEKNPMNFFEGRYGICKKCRSKMVNEKAQQKKYIDSIEKIKKIDPKEEIQTVIDYTLKYKSYGMEFSILDNIYEINKQNKILIENMNCINIDKKILFDNIELLDKYQNQISIAFNAMRNKIEEINLEILEFKRLVDIETIKNRLKDLENFRRDILDEKFRKENNS